MPLEYILNQSEILAKIKQYLRAHGREQEVIDRFSEGYCVGITTLWLYAKWLQTQPQADKLKARDDYTWLTMTATMIIGWDGALSALEPEDDADFDRFISYIEFFQNTLDYLPIKSEELGRTLEATVNNSEAPGSPSYLAPKKEYALGALFTLEQLTQLLKVPGIIQEQKLVLITSHNHATAVLKQGGRYYYFDSNASFLDETKSDTDEPLASDSEDEANNYKGDEAQAEKDAMAKVIAEPETLAAAIFTANQFEASEPSPLIFRMFSFAPQSKAYPDQTQLLEQIKPSLYVRRQDYADGRASLQLAAAAGSSDGVQYFLTHGADINYQDHHGDTPLMFAMCHGQINVVQLLLSSRDIDLNVVDAEQNTALMLAIMLGLAEEVKLLLANGQARLNLKVQNKSKDTALTLAVKCGYKPIVEYLLNTSSHKMDPQAQIVEREALQLAVIYGHAEIANFLLDSDLAAAKFDQEYIYAMFLLALQEDKLELIKRLFERSKQFNLNSQDVNGDSPLILAARNGSMHAVKFFLADPQTDLNLSNNHGNTALLEAAAHGHAEIVAALLAGSSAPASINAANQDKHTALMLASARGHANVVAILLQQHADPNLTDDQGNDALMLARHNGHLEIVKRLAANTQSKRKLLLARLPDVPGFKASKRNDGSRLVKAPPLQPPS